MDGLLRGIRAEGTAPTGAARAAATPAILYAPTWNPYLASVDMLGGRWLRELFDAHPDVRVLLKPHPHIPVRAPEWMARLEDWARADTRVRLVDPGADFYALMEQADVLLTDVSSIMFYYLALDRPLVLLNNPRRADDPYFEPEGPEWAWRDMGDEVDQEEDLAAGLLEALRHPERRAEARARYRERVFGSLTDGRAAARIAERVRALVLPAEHEREWVDALWHAFEANRRLREVESSVSYRLARRLNGAPRLKRMVGGVVRRVLR
jgi:CDP-glycerol glycerophosphotransferase (TagB/SpsB family)